MRVRFRAPALAAAGGVLAAAVAFAVLLGLGPGRQVDPGAPQRMGSDTLTVLAVGDIARCDGERDEQTAALAEQNDGTILALGDLAYPDGTAEDYRQCFEPSWGPLKDRIRPAPGNHEYNTAQAAPYFDYFGEAAGEPGQGWYSFDLGAWHIIALNSNCDQVGGCGPGSPQEQWLRADLAANTAQCTLAFWHEPRFSSGRTYGGTSDVAGLWRALAEANADVVLSGHEHQYERFAPLDGAGKPDGAGGVREFVVGTGGGDWYPFGKSRSGSQVRIARTAGVLKLTLGPTSYSWDLLPVDQGAKGDSGTDECR